MDAVKVVGAILQGRAGDPVLDITTRLIYVDRIRQPLLGSVERWLEGYLRARGGDPAVGPRIIREQVLTAGAIFATVDRLIARGAISPHLLRVIMGLWGRALTVPPERKPAVRRFQEEHGSVPPWFIAISPGRACNLRCPGCYSASDGSSTRLPWPILDRVVNEAKELWGINLVVVSGGEPMAYRSEGKGLLDLVEKHDDCLFLMFTNGTLIDEAVARRMERMGNITPALSVEGLRERTDQARGTGVFDTVMTAMRRLGEVGVPVGISATATRQNSEELLSDPFIDLFFEELGAFYGFLFQYMPMGRYPDVAMMPTPRQRLEVWRRSWEIVEKRKVFLFDFWNYGTMVHGCVAAGRERGYVHVDWNGKVMPCVFAPYSGGNINEVYERGGSLNDIWASPFFQAIRGWQKEYAGYAASADDGGNWLAPCPVRDHHRLFMRWLDEYDPDPQDEETGLHLSSQEVREGLLRYEDEFGEMSSPLWESVYLDKPL